MQKSTPVSKELLNSRIQNNLSLWSLQHRWIRGKKFSYAGHEYLRAIYNDRHSEIVIKKSAQCGASEYFISEAFFTAEKGYVVMFMFPADPQLYDFSHSRINPSVQDSPYLSSKVFGTDNVGLKQIGRGFVYFRGMQSNKKVKSVDADMLLFDEYDEMPEQQIVLAQKRVGHSKLKFKRYASTPTVPEMGIDALYEASDRRRWHIKCEHCGEWQFLTFEQNVDFKTVGVVCKKCRRPIDRLQKGEWIAEFPSRPVHGYHISKIFCARTSVRELIENSLKTRAFEVQEFHNSDLGEAYIVSGGRITEDLLISCIDDYAMTGTGVRTTMGVDVGSDINVRISSHRSNGVKTAAFIGTVKNFEDLDILMAQYDVSLCVIDAQPEVRKATEFCSRWKGRAFRCYYLPSDTGRGEYFEYDLEDQKIVANRTVAGDTMVNRFRLRTNRIPKNIRDISGYFDQMKAPIRMYKKDERGVEYAIYVEGSKADHYFHAEVYDEIAFNMIGKVIEDNAPSPVEIETMEEAGIERVEIGGGY